MSGDKIKELIENIEKKRKSRLVAFITGDKPNFGTKIADDAVPFFYKILKEIGKVEKLDIFLYSRGGNIVTPWRLINLLREYSDNLSVLIPFRAHSATTLMALGADEIIMGPLGELSPIDPSITTPFNPRSDLSKNQPIPISVEDIINYFDFAREELNIVEPSNLVELYKILVEKVDPIALGRVYRVYVQIRGLASRLMELSKYNDIKIRDNIIDLLTKKLYSHDYIIARREAENYGLKIVHAESKDACEIEDLMWDLYSEYAKKLEMDRPLNPKEKIEANVDEKSFILKRAVIESKNMEYSFDSNIKITKIKKGSQLTYNISVDDLGWKFTDERSV